MSLKYEPASEPLHISLTNNSGQVMVVTVTATTTNGIGVDHWGWCPSGYGSVEPLEDTRLGTLNHKPSTLTPKPQPPNR